jgi:hypothetical protein
MWSLMGKFVPELSLMGKLVPELPKVVPFSYDLHFRHVIAHWKGILEKYVLRCQTLSLFPF